MPVQGSDFSLLRLRPFFPFQDEEKCRALSLSFNTNLLQKKGFITKYQNA
jgi:hypothetical protein